MTLDLFKQISEANRTIDGWCEEAKAFTLASIVVATRPAVCLEIGLWKGKSFSAMALACKAINHGICIGVDPWSTEVAVQEQTTPEDKAWWATPDFEKVHAEFQANMAALGVENFIRIERRQSQHFQPPNQIGLASIDGSHSDTAMGDMVKVAPRIVIGGFIVTDDSNWAGGGVSRGERRLLEMGFKKLFVIGTGACFQRVH